MNWGSFSIAMLTLLEFMTWSMMLVIMIMIMMMIIIMIMIMIMAVKSVAR